MKAEEQRGGRCKTCRVMMYVERRRKYEFRPEWDEALRRGYRDARTRWDVTDLLDHVVRLTGFPRSTVVLRAGQLGLSLTKRRPWTAEEESLLRELYGTMSLRRIAQRLKRSESAIRNKGFSLGMQNEIFASYSENQLKDLFGVTHQKVRNWVRRGWLTLDQDCRIPEKSVERFVWNHLEEVEFRRVDEAWLKGILLPSFGLKVSPDRLRNMEPGDFPVTSSAVLGVTENVQ
jgi:hypothetical protein